MEDRRQKLVAAAQEQARLVRRNYDIDYAAYQRAENKLAKLNAEIRALDAEAAV